ncbi:MAG: efflux RND transporter periplasmic adaptor subunit [Rickettsiales bacterium]
MTPRQKVLVFIILAALVAGGLYYAGIVGGTSAKKEHLIVVGVKKLEPTTAKIKREFPARVKSNRWAEIRPQVSGIISKVMFEGGEYVKKGQQLYQIDPSKYQSIYNAKIASLKKAKANRKALLARKIRYDKYAGRGKVISTGRYEEAISEYEQSEADVKMAEAEMESASINLDRTKVIAPISGYIGRTHVTTGSLVTANQPEKLSIITQSDPIFVDIKVSSNALSKLKAALGDLSNIPAEIVMSNGQKYEEKGKILFHEIHVDKSTGSLRLRTSFPNSKGAIFDGMFVRVLIEEVYKDSYLIPQNVTWRDSDGNLFVWVVDNNNVANHKKIYSNDIVGEDWLVTTGIENGTLIIVDNFMHLKPGTKVSIANPPAEEDESNKSDEISEANKNPKKTNKDKEKPLLSDNIKSFVKKFSMYKSDKEQSDKHLPMKDRDHQTQHKATDNGEEEKKEPEASREN